MVLKGLTGREVSEMLGIDESTFSRKMNNGNFTRSEIAKLIEILSLDDPMSIFFADDTA
jgi:transcriptional regulator with XRE-family HTH domain